MGKARKAYIAGLVFTSMAYFGGSCATPEREVDRVDRYKSEARERLGRLMSEYGTSVEEIRERLKKKNDREDRAILNEDNLDHPIHWIGEPPVKGELPK